MKTAIDLTVASIEDGEIHYEHIGTLAVQLFARMHGLDAEAEEALDRLTFVLLNGETYETSRTTILIAPQDKSLVLHNGNTTSAP